jgi:hypothetical protein
MSIVMIDLGSNAEMENYSFQDLKLRSRVPDLLAWTFVVCRAKSRGNVIGRGSGPCLVTHTQYNRG